MTPTTPTFSAMIADDFAPLLERFAPDVLDAQAETIIGLREDFTIGYVNSAWSRFALQNKASSTLLSPEFVLGLSLLEPLARELHPFFEDLFARALAQKEPLTHTYECSSAEEVRFFELRLLYLESADATQRGLLALHSPTTPVAPFPLRDNPNFAPNWDDYYTSDNLLVQCSHCRRTRVGDDDNRWDWIPEAVSRPPGAISHGLCAVCLDYYYPVPSLKP